MLNFKEKVDNIIFHNDGRVELVNVDSYGQGEWEHLFAIYVPYALFLVSAQHEGDALDEVIDYWELAGYNGYFLTDEEIQELEQAGYLDEYIQGGNHGRYTSFTSYEIRIEKVI